MIIQHRIVRVTEWYLGRTNTERKRLNLTGDQMTVEGMTMNQACGVREMA